MRRLIWLSLVFATTLCLAVRHDGSPDTQRLSEQPAAPQKSAQEKLDQYYSSCMNRRPDLTPQFQRTLPLLPPSRDRFDSANPVEPSAANGAALFKNRCVFCHDSPANLHGPIGASGSAIARIEDESMPKMHDLPGISLTAEQKTPLTPAEKSALIQFLRSK